MRIAVIQLLAIKLLQIFPPLKYTFSEMNPLEVRFAKDFLPVILIQLNIHIGVIRLLAIRSLQIAAHATTVVLSSHIQIL